MNRINPILAIVLLCWIAPGAAFLIYSIAYDNGARFGFAAAVEEYRQFGEKGVRAVTWEAYKGDHHP